MLACLLTLLKCLPPSKHQNCMLRCNCPFAVFRRLASYGHQPTLYLTAGVALSAVCTEGICSSRMNILITWAELPSTSAAGQSLLCQACAYNICTSCTTFQHEHTVHAVSLHAHHPHCAHCAQLVNICTLCTPSHCMHNTLTLPSMPLYAHCAQLVNICTLCTPSHCMHNTLTLQACHFMHTTSLYPGFAQHVNACKSYTLSEQHAHHAHHE